MAVKRHYIAVPKGAVEKICNSLNCSRATVFHALNYNSNTDLGRKIRQEAVEVYGGVESIKVVW